MLEPVVNPFRVAKQFLCATLPDSLSKSCYICVALHKAYNAGYIGGPLYMQSARYVEWQLGGCKTVESWLCRNVPGYMESIHENGNSTQEYRHRWLAHLADQFDKGLIKL